jgi:hypothetical protein
MPYGRFSFGYSKGQNFGEMKMTSTGLRFTADHFRFPLLDFINRNFGMTN